MSNFDRVLSHLGHELEVAVYSDNQAEWVEAEDLDNVAIECLTCMEVVVDYNKGDNDE